MLLEIERISTALGEVGPGVRIKPFNLFKPFGAFGGFSQSST